MITSKNGKKIKIIANIRKPKIPLFCARCMSKNPSKIRINEVDKNAVDKIISSSLKVYNQYGEEKSIASINQPGDRWESKEKFQYSKRKFNIDFLFCDECNNIEDIKTKNEKKLRRALIVLWFIPFIGLTVYFGIGFWKIILFIILSYIFIGPFFFIARQFFPDKGKKSVSFNIEDKKQGEIYNDNMEYEFYNNDYAAEFIYANWYIINIGETFKKKSSINIIPIIGNKKEGQKHLVEILKKSEKTEIINSLKKSLNDTGLALVQSEKKDIGEWKIDILRSK